MGAFVGFVLLLALAGGLSHAASHIMGDEQQLTAQEMIMVEPE